jgi:outer membrane protein
MKKVVPFFLLIMIFSRIPLLAAEEKISLAECYRLALQRSDIVAISNEEIVQAEARYMQALGSVLPKIAFLATETLQDPAVNTAATNTFQETFTRLSTPQLAVNLKQPIFRGFREFNALRASRADQAQKKLLKIEAERQLFLDVVVAYLTIAEIERDIDTTKKIITVSQRRITDLKERIGLGKSRESEGSLQETNLSLLQADLEQKMGDRRVAYEMLSFFTGLDPSPPIQTKNPSSEKPQAMDYYVTMGGNRPDVQASLEAINVAVGLAKIEKGNLLPTADLDANYYPYRVGFLKEINWDAKFSLAVPIFNFETLGNIKEANSRVKQAEYQAEEIRRQALTEIKKSFEAYQYSRGVYGKYSVATGNANKSYLLQVGDFEKGLINNQDVLESQNTLFSAMRLRDTAEIGVWINWFRLQIASGILP